VKAHRKEADTLFNLMHAATLAGVDPALGYRQSIVRRRRTRKIRSLKLRMRSRPGEADLLQARIDEIRTRLDNEKVRKQAYPPLTKRYAALSDEAKGVYRRMRDLYSKRFDEREAAVLEQLRGLLRAPGMVADVVGRATELDPTLDEAQVTVAMTRLDQIWGPATSANTLYMAHFTVSDHRRKCLPRP